MNFKYTYKHFDPLKFVEIFNKPDWYIQIQLLIQKYFIDYHIQSNLTGIRAEGEFQEIRQELVSMVEDFLDNKSLFIDEKEFVFDENRKPIDTVVVHHSGNPCDLSVARINALQLLNIYSKSYLNPRNDHYGKPITSGHFFEEKPTFIAYHFIIWPDGSFKQFLKDEYVGAHCGNSYYNQKSIGICFHDRLYETSPTQKAIKSAKKIIQRYNPKEILGHREIQPNVICPGNTFLGAKGWKKELLN